MCDPEGRDIAQYFSTNIDNEFFPLNLLTELVLEGEDDGETVLVEITVPGDTERRNIMKSKRIILSMGVLICTLLLILGGCSSNSSNNSNNDKVKDTVEDPLFADAIFSNPTQIDNQYLPLIPGTVHLYNGVARVFETLVMSTRQPQRSTG